MRSHDRRRDEDAASAPKAPAPETPAQSPMELAGTIGNSAMQRVAESPALQGSPAAAPFAPTIARAGRDELLGAQAYGGGEAFMGGGGGGEELMAHEASHVVQQGAAVADTQRGPQEQRITPEPGTTEEPESAPEPESGAGGAELSPYAEKTFSEQDLEDM